MEQLEIFVESLTGSLLQFQVSPFETVLSLKEKIQNLQGIPVNHQHLIHQDRELDNDLSLYNYNIQNGSTLRLILHMRGGPISTRPLTADLTQQTLLEEMATEYMESLTGENWPHSGADGGGSVASGVSGDSETQTDARAPSTTSASPTPVPPSSQPHPRHVTLLVLRDGDQLNFYRVVDRSASMVVANGGMAATFDALVSPSASAIGDDQSSASSEATLNGSASCVEAPAQSFNTSKEKCPNEQLLPPDQHHFVEDKTRQKMAELRTRLMTNTKQVQIHNSGAAVASGLSTTPVLMPRPPSSAAVQRISATKIQDTPSKPYIPTAMSSLRRRRLTNQQSLPVSGSPPKGVGSTPPHEQHNVSNVSNNSFASLADYFRSKEEGGNTTIANNGASGPVQESSPSPLPSPLHKKHQQIQTVERHPSQQSQQDIVRCSPYLRELFAGTRFFVMDQQQQEKTDGDNTVTRSVNEAQQAPPKSSPMLLKPRTANNNNKPLAELPFEHLIGESVVQQQQRPTEAPPATAQKGPPRTARSSGLANAFAALLERQTSQTTPPQPPPPPTKKPSAPIVNPARTTQSSANVAATNSNSNNDPDGDVDVLERALNTLLFKAELEHLGSSRLPVGLIQPPSNNDIGIKDHPRVGGTAHHKSVSSTRSGGTANNLHVPRQQHPFGGGGGTSMANRGSIVGSTPSKFLSTNGSKKDLALSSSSTTKLPAIVPPPSQQMRAPAAPAPITRCAVCNRRTGLATTYVCRCMATFCTVHRYPEAHQCTYDYKGEGRRAIQANNPVITADKLPKI